MTKLLTIIIPIFNSSATLEKCLDSLLLQITDKVEIICVNDGSTDHSERIIESYLKKNSNFSYVSQVNKGLSAARNAGIKEASGKYITFLDADDTFVENAVEKILEVISEDCCDLLGWGTFVNYFAWENLKESDNEYFKIRYGRNQVVKPEMFNLVNVAAWNKAFRKDIVSNHNISFPVGLWYEDAAFFWIYLSCCKTVSFIPDKLTIYNRFPSSIMSETFQRKTLKVLDHLRVAEHVYERLCEMSSLRGLEYEFQKFLLNNFIQTIKYLPRKFKIFGVVAFIKSYSKMRELNSLSFIVRLVFIKTGKLIRRI